MLTKYGNIKSEKLISFTEIPRVKTQKRDISDGRTDGRTS